MKKIFAIIFCIFTISFAFANPPRTISYQAVVRNAQGALVQEKTLGIRISIITDEKAETLYIPKKEQNPQIKTDFCHSLSVKRIIIIPNHLRT